MNRFFIFIILNFFSILSFSQTLDWARVLNGQNYDYGYLIDLDGSGNIYVSGYMTPTQGMVPSGLGPGSSSNDILIAKYDPSGNFIWGHLIGGISYDQSWGMKVSTNGDIFITGSIGDETVDFDPGPGVASFPPIPPNSNRLNDCFVAKYNTNGQYQWAYVIGDNVDIFSDIEQGRGIDIDQNQNVYVTGIFNGTVNFDPNGSSLLTSHDTDSDIFLLKLDSNGQFQWVKKIGGVSNIIDVEDLRVDQQGNSYIIGKHIGQIDVDPSTSSFYLTGNASFLAKYDLGGNLLWAVNMNSLVTDLWGLEISPIGRVYVSGMRSGDVWFAYINKNNGSIYWQKQLDCSATSASFSISADVDQNLHVGGFFSSNIDLDPSPNIRMLSSNGTYNAFFGKYDATGNFINGGGFGGSYIDQVYDIDSDSYGNTYITGIFDGDVDIDVLSNTQYINDPWPAFGIFICKYSTSPIVIPIDLLSLKADQIENNIIEISWKTLSEINNDYFEINRSYDMINWESIGTVDGSGNSQIEQRYYFLDDSFSEQESVVYYKISQFDLNGSHSTTDMVSVSIRDLNQKLFVFPNPVRDILRFSFSVTGKSYKLFTNDGKLINSDILIGEQLDISYLQSSKYYIIVYDDTNVIMTASFIKE